MKQGAQSYVVAFLIILTINFFLPRLMPGDPLTAIYGQEALISLSEDAQDELIREMGLDQNLLIQFKSYLINFLQGDLGYSYSFQAPVHHLILQTLSWTLGLVAISLLLATFMAFLLGIHAAWHHNQLLDRILTQLMVFGSGFPNFFIGAVLLGFFGVELGWFPLFGGKTSYAELQGLAYVIDLGWHLSLPVITLTLAFIPELFLLVRASTLNLLNTPFILTANAKGVRLRRIKFYHVGLNTLLPLISRLGIIAGKGLTSALFVEIIFSYPGIGQLIQHAILSRDYALIQGIFLVMAFMVLGLNLMADFLTYRLDPRIRHAY